jgi:hypothetical protein
MRARRWTRRMGFEEGEFGARRAVGVRLRVRVRATAQGEN